MALTKSDELLIDWLSYTGANAVDETQLKGSDGVKINDVLITELAHQTSDNVHATDKVAAINAKTSETGVVASASTGIIVGVDMSAPTMYNTLIWKLMV